MKSKKEIARALGLDESEITDEAKARLDGMTDAQADDVLGRFAGGAAPPARDRDVLSTLLVAQGLGLHTRTGR